MNDPHDALQAILQGGELKTRLFPPTSRYYDIDTATLVTPGGVTVIYLRRRAMPDPASFAVLQEYVVTDSDRLDNITYRYLGDPEQFWRICDANGALHPEELEVVGRRLRITMPAGIPGAPNG